MTAAGPPGAAGRPLADTGSAFADSGLAGNVIVMAGEFDLRCIDVRQSDTV